MGTAAGDNGASIAGSAIAGLPPLDARPSQLVVDGGAEGSVMLSRSAAVAIALPLVVESTLRPGMVVAPSQFLAVAPLRSLPLRVERG